MINLNLRITKTPDFSGPLFYVESGRRFDVADYADAYGLNPSDISRADAFIVELVSTCLRPGEWLLVEHVNNLGK